MVLEAMPLTMQTTVSCVHLFNLPFPKHYPFVVILIVMPFKHINKSNHVRITKL